MCVIYVDLKANIWSFRIGERSSSTDYYSLVYKIDNSVQSSLLSSFVLNSNIRFHFIVQL